MDKQELVDRLGTAVAEGDVLYVLYWIEQMREQECLEEGLQMNHSWKQRTVYDEAVQHSRDLFRQLILEILLHLIDEPRLLPARRMAQQLRQTWASDLMSDWTCGGKEEAKDAATLLSLNGDDVATWIDDHLQPHPKWESLTGCNALPPPPSPLVDPSLPSPILAAQVASPAPQGFDRSQGSIGDFHPPSFAPTFEASAVVEFALANLPLDTTMDDVYALFAFASLCPVGVRLRQKPGAYSKFATGVLVSASEWIKAASVLHGTRFRTSAYLYLNRNPPPSFSDCHPYVLLSHLSPAAHIGTIFDLSHRCGCGIYSPTFSLDPLTNYTTGTGSFRVETDEIAAIAAERIRNLAKQDGQCIMVDWSHSSTPSDPVHLLPSAAHSVEIPASPSDPSPSLPFRLPPRALLPTTGSALPHLLDHATASPVSSTSSSLPYPYPSSALSENSSKLVGSNGTRGTKRKPDMTLEGVTQRVKRESEE